MKKYCLILFALIFHLSCDDISTSELAGKWQLKTVEKNGVETIVDTVWYNFQSESVFTLQIYVPQQDTFLLMIGMKTQQEKVVSIELASETYINYSDWNSINRDFTINEVNRKKLILRSEEGYTYSFIKF
jgi:hypothetical protein